MGGKGKGKEKEIEQQRETDKQMGKRHRQWKSRTGSGSGPHQTQEQSIPRAANPRPPSSKAAALNQRVNGGLKDRVQKEKAEAGNYKSIQKEIVEEGDDFEREFQTRMDEALRKGSRYTKQNQTQYQEEDEEEDEESEEDDAEEEEEEEEEEYINYMQYLEEKNRRKLVTEKEGKEAGDGYLYDGEEYDEEEYDEEEYDEEEYGEQQKEEEARKGTETGFIPLGVGPVNLDNYHLNYDKSMKAHILIATPCYGGVIHDGFAQSLISLSNLALTMEGIDITIKLLPGDSL